MSFLTQTDYSAQIRSEVAKFLDPTLSQDKLAKAESFAIGQIRNHLAGKYDVDTIFAPLPDDAETDTRNPFIIMLTIDIALYHLWSKEGGNNIPKTRELRYNDALEWLKTVQKGLACDLPLIKNGDGSEASDIRIWSLKKQENNSW